MGWDSQADPAGFVGPDPDDLAKMADAEIKARAAVLKYGRATPGEYEFWVNELASRRLEAQNIQMVGLTQSMRRLTVIGLIVAIVALVVAVVALVD